MKTCKLCNTELLGRQVMYCSKKCKNNFLNKIHKPYPVQKVKGVKRKTALIIFMGGECSKCGYKKNLAAFEFHHVDRDAKDFMIDARTFANHSWKNIIKETAKCILVCANCHREEHHPDSELIINDSVKDEIAVIKQIHEKFSAS